MAGLHVIVHDVPDLPENLFALILRANHTRPDKTILLEWSRHTRDLFPEMRKAVTAQDARTGKKGGIGSGNLFEIRRRTLG